MVNRNQILVILTVVLLFGAIAYHVWADWGLVTIHASKEPLNKVIASIERQGHARIETDLPGDVPVDMNVDKVPLTDALETLSVLTNSRWRLLFFAAADKATLKTGETAWFKGQRPADWRMISFPFAAGPVNDDDPDAAPLDPRGDLYTPKTNAPAPVQTFFTEAAALTNAGFAFPTAWNPTVTTTVKSGVVDHVVPKLISYAHGKEDELFYLSAGGPGGGGGRFAGGGGGGPDMQLDPSLFEQRIQNEINRLPPEERADAQTNFDAEKAFRASLANMSDDERRAAFMAHMQDPAVQDARAAQQDAREGRMSHDQRTQRFANYVTRKLTITGKME
jgi:hypothetical protein